MKILFACPGNEFGVIAEPIAANKSLPEWYRKLPPVDEAARSVQQSGKTVKACYPFLDAMTIGWILPVPVDMTVKVSNDGARVEFGHRYPHNLITEHYAHQIRGHARQGHPVRKMMTMWSARTDPGVSCLITQPLNRDGLPFQVISGVVDTDRSKAYMNLPFFIDLPDGIHKVEKGTPFAQVIPFSRDEIEAEVRADTIEEMQAADHQVRLILSEDAAYRKHVRHQ